MLKKLNLYNFLLGVFLVLSLGSPLTYLYGLFINPKYLDLRAKPTFLIIISPMPLLFDRIDFFILPQINYKLTDGTQLKIRFSKNLIANLDGDSHRKLHIMRLFAFYYFFDREIWQLATKHLACFPEKLKLNIDKNLIDGFYVTGHEGNFDPSPKYFKSEYLVCPK